MATPTWPETLPAPRIGGYGYKQVDPNARTQMDAGNRRVRRRFIVTPTDVTLQFRVTEAQLAVFEAWFESDALAGQAWCTLPLVNGQGKTMVRARFRDTPQVSGVDGATGIFDVSVPAETMSMPTNG